MAPVRNLDVPFFRCIFRSERFDSRFDEVSTPKNTDVLEHMFLVTNAISDTAVCFFLFKLNDEWVCEYSKEENSEKKEGRMRKYNEELILLKSLKFWQDLLQMEEVQWTVLADVDDCNLSENVIQVLSEIRHFRQTNRTRVVSNCEHSRRRNNASTNEISDGTVHDLIFSDGKLNRAAQCLIHNDIEEFKQTLGINDVAFVDLGGI